MLQVDFLINMCYDDRETAYNLILHENGFEGYNWKFGYGISTEETKKDFEFIFQNLKKGMELVQPDKDFKPKYLIADNADAICNGFLSGM